jgi:hypothetical protein
MSSTFSNTAPFIPSAAVQFTDNLKLSNGFARSVVLRPSPSQIDSSHFRISQRFTDSSFVRISSIASMSTFLRRSEVHLKSKLFGGSGWFGGSLILPSNIILNSHQVGKSPTYASSQFHGQSNHFYDSPTYASNQWFRSLLLDDSIVRVHSTIFVGTGRCDKSAPFA